MTGTLSAAKASPGDRARLAQANPARPPTSRERRLRPAAWSEDDLLMVAKPSMCRFWRSDPSAGRRAFSWLQRRIHGVARYIHREPIQRLSRRHVQRLPLRAAERHVG